MLSFYSIFKFLFGIKIAGTVSTSTVLGVLFILRYLYADPGKAVEDMKDVTKASYTLFSKIGEFGFQG